jgi:hypothetical protein
VSGHPDATRSEPVGGRGPQGRGPFTVPCCARRSR